jgi:hypothetical protein
MGNLSSFQHQKLRPANTVQSSFALQVRPSTPVPTPLPQVSSEHARQFRDGIERMSIFPREQNAAPRPYGGQRTADTVQRKRSFTKQMMQRQDRNEIQEQHVPPKKNQTGLPDTLKAGIESLSGLSLDDVHVHYNSSEPAQVQALAYTQGTEIHVGPGQERHLAHEAWHVVQQKQGRVKSTLQAKGMMINDDQGLEQEADLMGKNVTRVRKRVMPSGSIYGVRQKGDQLQQAHTEKQTTMMRGSTLAPIIQRMIINVGEDSLYDELAKPNGWIIASDIDIALQEGGDDQEIWEFNQLEKYRATGRKVSHEEDIYLVGHGSAQLVGVKLPEEVSKQLLRILPKNYRGTIRSLSCSTGQMNEQGKSAVSKLKTNLSKRTNVTGVSGITLNHSVYEGGSRAITETQYERYVEPAINQTIASVNEDWEAYVKAHGVSNLKKAALVATSFSMHFYENLQRKVRKHLIPEEETMITV